MIAKKRDTYFDFLRGIAIILVIGVHTFPISIVEDVNSLSRDFQWLIRQITNCAVPIFFAISGYFFSNKKINTYQDYFQLLKKQITKVYIPILFWGIPFLILGIRADHNIVGLIIRYFVGGLSIFYFVTAIIQFYILLPAFQKMTINKLVICGVITSISILAITYIRHIQGIDLPLIVYAGSCLVWLVFYALGCYLREEKRREEKRREEKRRVWFYILFAGLILSYLESSFLIKIHGGGYGYLISNYIFSFALIMILFSQYVKNYYYDHKNIFTEFICKLGAVSFGMYLTHCFILVIIGVIENKTVLFFSFQSWPIKWLLTLCLDYLFIITIKKFIPNKYCKYIGLN